MEFYLIPPVSYQTQEKLKKKTKRTKKASSSSSGSNSSSSSLSRDLLASRRGSTSASSFTSNSIFSSATSTKSRKSSCCSIETASTATTTTTTNKSKTSSNAIPMPISSTSLTQPRSLSRKPTNSSDSHSINSLKTNSSLKISSTSRTSTSKKHYNYESNTTMNEILSKPKLKKKSLRSVFKNLSLNNEKENSGHKDHGYDYPTDADDNDTLDNLDLNTIYSDANSIFSRRKTPVALK